VPFLQPVGKLQGAPVHFELLQYWPEGQSLPHMLQLKVSPLRSTQAFPQQLSGAAQVCVLQLPPVPEPMPPLVAPPVPPPVVNAPVPLPSVVPPVVS
jgi:hypothetical protein